MISKARIKWIKSLELQKYRLRHSAFVAEGPKLVGELLPYSTPLYVAATPEWLSQNSHLIGNDCTIDEVTTEELKRASLLRTPQSVLAVMPILRNNLDVSSLKEQLIIALDAVQDPGNLGTIIRVADWFGIKNIYCSLDTADVWNPKVVQATMGSIARVAVRYQPLAELLDTLPPDFPVYGTMLDGDDISETKFNSSGIIVMGNEGNGISPDIAQRLNHRVLIPNFPKGEPTADSLNVAIATAITCFVARNAK